MGQRASQGGALNFADVDLPDEALLGEEGRGFHMMMSVLDKGRVGIAALAVGMGQAGLEAALEYARQRKQFGQPITEFQGVQWLLADIAKDVEAARLLVHSAATKLDRGENATRACSMAKCFASDMAVARTSDAVRYSAAVATFAGSKSNAFTATPRSRRSTRAPIRSSA